MKLEARRAQIRERIQRQHEIAARAYYKSQAAEERAKAELSRFKGQKPLYEKLAENYSQLERQQVGIIRMVGWRNYRAVFSSEFDWPSGLDDIHMAHIIDIAFALFSHSLPQNRVANRYPIITSS